MQFLADAKRDIAEMIRFSEPAGVLEIRARMFATLTAFDPFFVMTFDARDRLRRKWKVFELVFWEQLVFAVIGQKHSFRADKQNATAPLRNFFPVPNLGLGITLV